MAKTPFKSIVIVGTGRLARNLCKAFREKNTAISQIVGRNALKANELAELAQAKAVVGIENMSKTADLYILAVSDDAIGSVAAQMPAVNGLVVHTSGMMESTVLKAGFKNSGVFYPLQTFSLGRWPDFSHIPLLLQATDEQNLCKLSALAENISECVLKSNDRQRQSLHLAAVFVNNFGNALFTMANDILQNEHLSLNLLEPLILETAQKIEKQSPAEAQSGPARRNDTGTIRKHMEMLKQYPELESVYQLFTEYLQKKYPPPL